MGRAIDNTASTGNVPPGPPFPGRGWDVGTGQCNGDFTISSTATLEVGLRARDRSSATVSQPLPGVYSV